MSDESLKALKAAMAQRFPPLRVEGGTVGYYPDPEIESEFVALRDGLGRILATLPLCDYERLAGAQNARA